MKKNQGICIAIILLLVLLAIGACVWSKLLFDPDTNSQSQFIRNTSITTKEDMYDYLVDIGDNFQESGNETEAMYGGLIKDFSHWLRTNPEDGNDMFNALNDLVGIPTVTAQNIVFNYARDKGLNPGTTQGLQNLISYDIVRYRTQDYEGFDSEAQAELTSLVQNAYIGNNDDLLNLLQEVQDMYKKSNDPKDRKVSEYMDKFLVYLTMQLTAGIAVRNALNYTSGNPRLAIYTAIERYGNATNAPKHEVKALQDAFLNTILVARRKAVDLDPVLQNAAPIVSSVPWAPTGLREIFDTNTKTTLNNMVLSAKVDNADEAVMLLKNVGNFYINNGNVHQGRIGKEIVNMANWIDKYPQQKSLLYLALTGQSHPAFTMQELIGQYLEFHDKPLELEEALYRPLIYGLIQIRFGPKY